MQQSAVYMTENALHWLEVILKERFGHDWQLVPHASGVQLKLAGSNKTIYFNSVSADFKYATSDLPCSYWDPEMEGLQTPLCDRVPAPGAYSLASPLIRTAAQGLDVEYDIIGLMHWMLSRQEEVGRTDLDSHGRFSAFSSHAFKHGYLERPIVDEWVCILKQLIERVWPDLVLKRHQFRTILSHDVDVPSRYAFNDRMELLRTMGGDVLKRRDLRSALRAPWIWANSRETIHPLDPLNTFDWIMDLSEKKGLLSAFYFICGHTSSLDADYEPEDMRIRQLMRRIHERGHEIGLHPSYGSYQNSRTILQEANRLRSICAMEGIQQAEWGGRMHYLRWEHPTTMRAWAAAGMNYDSSLGYADHPGFRCGTCFEFPAFDPVEQKMLPLRVRPLVMMECSLIEKRYLGLGTGQDALDKALKLKNACQKVGGGFTLLWHNSSLQSPSYKNLYESILSET